MPSGSIIQLAAIGPQDDYLTSNPNITYFTAVYKKYSNFAIETIEDIFAQNPEYGQKSFIDFGRYGDLISQIFIKINLPRINITPPTDDYAISWINGIGNFIIKHVDIEIDGQIIDRHYGQWMDIWTELTTDASKRQGYYELIGKHDYFDCTTQQGPLELYIPLQFWFCRNIGLSIPLIALQNASVRMNIIFREFNELWTSSTGSIEPIIKQLNCGSNGKKYDYKTVKDAFKLNTVVLIDYIYLDETERRYFAQLKHEYLFDQLHDNLYTESLSNIDNIIDFHFNHPTKELIWVIQDQSVLTRRPNGGNEWGNYSNKSTATNTPSIDPMVSCKILFEGRDRFRRYDAKYFRVVQPYQRHTYTTDKYIHVYSFSLKPEEYQPSGTANFSRIDNATLNIKTIDGLIEPIITVYGPHYNILKIENGVAGVLFID